MPAIIFERDPEGTIVRLGGMTFSLAELKRRAMAIRGEVRLSADIRRRPGDGQMRWKDGSYLTADQVKDEQYQRDMDIM